MTESKDKTEELDIGDYECVFVKHRDKIKFEDFEKNHPGLYVPYVCFNFLFAAIIPKLYEDSRLEASRKYLLQERGLILDILATFINTALNTDVTMNRSVFEDIVTNFRQIGRDGIESCFLPETYMDDTCKRKFLQALTKRVRRTVSDRTEQIEPVTSSKCLVPSTSFYTTYHKEIPQGQFFWAPPIWTVTHYASYVLDKLGKLSKLGEKSISIKSKSRLNEMKEHMSGLSGYFDILLPCGFCRYHYQSTRYVDGDLFDRPFPVTLPYLAYDYSLRNDLFTFFSLLHTSCKPKYETSYREELGVDYYRGVYRTFYEDSAIV